MPLTRPDVISDCVSLSDKLTRPDRPFVPKDGAIDAALATVIDELAPDKECVGIAGSEHDGFAWADKLGGAASSPGCVVPLEKFVTGSIAVPREIPVRNWPTPYVSITGSYVVQSLNSSSLPPGVVRQVEATAACGYLPASPPYRSGFIGRK